MEAVFLALVLMLSIFLGFELISKVPATLHLSLIHISEPTRPY